MRRYREAARMVFVADRASCLSPSFLLCKSPLRTLCRRRLDFFVSPKCPVALGVSGWVKAHLVAVADAEGSFGRRLSPLSPLAECVAIGAWVAALNDHVADKVWSPSILSPYLAPRSRSSSSPKVAEYLFPSPKYPFQSPSMVFASPIPIGESPSSPTLLCRQPSACCRPDHVPRGARGSPQGYACNRFM